MPYVSRHIINCTAPRSQSDSSADSPMRACREARFTLAWVCGRHPSSTRVDMKTAPSLWDHFLRETASRVLGHWDDYLERIVYRHTAAPWMSVSLGEDRITPIYKEGRGMRDEQWKLM